MKELVNICGIEYNLNDVNDQIKITKLIEKNPMLKEELKPQKYYKAEFDPNTQKSIVGISFRDSDPFNPIF